MQRVSLRRAGERVKGGVLFREREHPLWNPQRKAFFHCKQAARRGVMLADATSCARRCRVSIAIRFGLLLLSAAALPILWECTVISVYRQSLQCGERSNAAFGKQSAAVQTSLAPHDSKARLRVVTTCRRFMAKPCTPHLHCAARAVLRAALLQWRGQGAEPLAFSWGSKGAILSRERMAPLSASPCTVQGNCNYIT